MNTSADTISDGDSIIQQAPAYFYEFGIRAESQNYWSFLNVATEVGEWQSLNAPAPIGVLDALPAGGSMTDPRTEISTLADYYLLADPKSTFLNLWGGSDPAGDWSSHWFGALAYNVGTPTGTWRQYASGSESFDASYQYRVYARDYTNALVLYKPLSFSTWTSPAPPTDSTSATTFNLGGTYRVLNADGTLGAPVTTATLRDGEGAVLIKA
jgi:hypothetical protein